jgi:hypothetical protein
MSQASEFGSLAMATDQASRMLKIYRKKLFNSKEMVDLHEIESQVSGLLKTIREKKEKAKPAQVLVGSKQEPAKVVTESDVDQLAVLLEGSRMAESPTTDKQNESSAAVSAAGGQE